MSEEADKQDPILAEIKRQITNLLAKSDAMEPKEQMAVLSLALKVAAIDAKSVEPKWGSAFTGDE